jgi:hypothetical protein
MADMGAWTDMYSNMTNNSVSPVDLSVNPLNAELNPICHLLALLGGATIVVVSRIRVNVHSIPL